MNATAAFRVRRCDLFFKSILWITFNLKAISLTQECSLVTKKIRDFYSETAALLFRYTMNASDDTFRITYRFKYRLTDDTFRHSSTCRFWNTRARSFLLFIFARHCLEALWIIISSQCIEDLILYYLRSKFGRPITWLHLFFYITFSDLMRADKKSM